MPEFIGLPEISIDRTGISVLLGLFVFLLFAGGVTLSRRGVTVSGPALVLKMFDTNSSDPKTMLNLVGRPQGIIGWLLSAIGLDVTTTFSITQDFVFINQFSLSGQFRQTAPVHNIASTHCGYSMNLGMLILAGVALPAGLTAAAVLKSILPFLIGLIVALVLVLAFFSSKYLLIAFQTSGGAVLGVRFRKGVIQNVPVGVEQLNQVVALFNQQLRRLTSTELLNATARKVEQWYYAKDGKKLGPVSASQLKRMVHSGELSPADMLWKDGMAKWVPVRDFKWG